MQKMIVHICKIS